MAAGLANILTTYTAALVTAGFTALPQGMTIGDVAALDTSKKIFLIWIESGISEENSYGAGVSHFSERLVVECHWNPEADETKLQQRLANDVETISIVMRKLGNRPSEVMQVRILGGVLKYGKNDVSWLGKFQIDYRITADET